MEEDGFMIRMEKEGKELEERLEKATAFLNCAYNKSQKKKKSFLRKTTLTMEI